MNIQNLLKRSTTLVIDAAIQEWVFNQDVCFDKNGHCDYCGRRNQKMQFEIKNTKNGNLMFIGAGCLLHLCKRGLQCIDCENYDLTTNDLRKFISDCRYIHISESRKKNTLKYLYEINKRSDINMIIEEFIDKGYFEISIALYLINEFNRLNIKYDETMFRINIARKYEKENFLNLNARQYKKLKPSLNHYQQTKYEERF